MRSRRFGWKQFSQFARDREKWSRFYFWGFSESCNYFGIWDFHEIPKIDHLTFGRPPKRNFPPGCNWSWNEMSPTLSKLPAAAFIEQLHAILLRAHTIFLASLLQPFLELSNSYDNLSHFSSWFCLFYGLLLLSPASLNIEREQTCIINSYLDSAAFNELFLLIFKLNEEFLLRRIAQWIRFTYLFKAFRSPTFYLPQNKFFSHI